MYALQLPLMYLLWHYTAAWVDLARLYLNISWFLTHFFSIRLHVQTLFAPWKRLREEKGGEGGIVGRFIINTITRLVGFLLRSLVILGGLAALVGFSVFMVFLCALWLILPIAVVSLFVFGGMELMQFVSEVSFL
ncbi:MAG: hypothetical protein Q7R88_00270 [bacterium]|nr:hypothetical protein [bacterium]